MNRRVVSGATAGLAALVLATGGTTMAAFDDNADVDGNRIGTGVLQLDLDNGAGTATLTFPGLEPGDRSIRRVWLVRNDLNSSVPGTLQVVIAQPVDTPGACAVSRGKAEGEIASGIPGCTLTATGATGTPAIGVLSRLVGFRATIVPATDAASCSTGPASGTFLPDSAPGALARLAAARSPLAVQDTAAHPLVLAPGAAVCVAVTAYWPPDATDSAHASPAHPVDNAGQGDSMSVAFRFRLSQVTS